MRIHRVGREAHGIFDGLEARAFGLGHHVIGNHAPAFADVEFVRPSAGLGEFARGQSECGGLRADHLGHGGIVLRKPHQPLLVVHVILKHLLARGVAGLGPRIVRADVVGGKAALVVAVTVVKLGRVRRNRLRFQVAFEQRVAVAVVARGLREWGAVGGIREEHAEVVGLHFFVAVARLAGRLRGDCRQQSALGISRLAIRIHGHGKIVRLAELHAVDRLAVRRVALATDVIRDARGGHQIALVGRINEYFCAHRVAVLDADGLDARAVLHDILQPVLVVNGHARFLEQLLKRLLRLGRTEAGGLADLRIHFIRKSADGLAVADVRRSEPARSHPADVPPHHHEHCLFPHARRLHRSRDAARSPAVHADVRLDHQGRIRGRNGVVIVKAGRRRGRARGKSDRGADCEEQGSETFHGSGWMRSVERANG